MTTEAIESLTDHTTGSPNPENSAPPQTIIRPELSPFNIGGIIPIEPNCSAHYDEVLNYGEAPIIRSPHPSDDGPGEEDGPWAKGWADRTSAEHIIRRGKGGVVDQHEPFTVSSREIHQTDPIPDAIRQRLVEAEQRRQTVQAEAMVNLAVGIVLTRQGLTSIGISKQDLIDFQQNYTVKQQIGEDGGFIITVTPKE